MPKDKEIPKLAAAMMQLMYVELPESSRLARYIYDKYEAVTIAAFHHTKKEK